jgi:hypothetical protein
MISVRGSHYDYMACTSTPLMRQIVILFCGLYYHYMWLNISALKHKCYRFLPLPLRSSCWWYCKVWGRLGVNHRPSVLTPLFAIGPSAQYLLAQFSET